MSSWADMMDEDDFKPELSPEYAAAAANAAAANATEEHLSDLNVDPEAIQDAKNACLFYEREEVASGSDLESIPEEPEDEESENEEPEDPLAVYIGQMRFAGSDGSMCFCLAPENGLGRHRQFMDRAIHQISYALQLTKGKHRKNSVAWNQETIAFPLTYDRYSVRTALNATIQHGRNGRNNPIHLFSMDPNRYNVIVPIGKVKNFVTAIESMNIDDVKLSYPVIGPQVMTQPNDVVLVQIDGYDVIDANELDAACAKFDLPVPRQLFRNNPSRILTIEPLGEVASSAAGKKQEKKKVVTSNPFAALAGDDDDDDV